MSTKKIQILNSTVKQAQNADTLDGMHADEFATANDVESKQSQHNAVTITLSASGWNDSAQVINVVGVTSTNTIVVSPSPDSLSTYGEAGVYCSAQETDALTFICKSTPIADVNVNVAIFP